MSYFAPQKPTGTWFCEVSSSVWRVSFYPYYSQKPTFANVCYLL